MSSAPALFGGLTDPYVLSLAAILCQFAERAPEAGAGARADRPAHRLPLAPAARFLIGLGVTAYTVTGFLEIGAGLGAPGFAELAGLTPGASRARVVAGTLLFAAGSAALILYWRGWSRVPGLRALRPRAPISWLAIALFLGSLAVNLTPATGEMTVAAVSSAPQQTLDLVLGSLPIGLLGVAAVGPVVRRSVPSTLRRLGLLPLRPAWMLAGIAAGVVTYYLAGPVGGFLERLTPPDCQAQQAQVTLALVSVCRPLLARLSIALAAGACEELLYRGALQPRFGITLTSIVWAAAHAQYTCHGLPSASNVLILALGFEFGLLRRYGGLWAALIAHVVYDGIILAGGGC